MLSHSLGKLLAVDEISRITVLLQEGDSYWPTLSEARSPRVQSAAGGSERHLTVLKGLQELDQAKADDWVLVHDAVRPCVSSTDIRKLITALADNTVGGLLAVPADNTLKKANEQNAVVATVDRRDLWNALTPQMFRFQILYDALQQAIEQGAAVTDEASAVELAGWQPLLVSGDKSNIKITHEGDLALSELILQMQECSYD